MLSSKRVVDGPSLVKSWRATFLSTSQSLSRKKLSLLRFNDKVLFLLVISECVGIGFKILKDGCAVRLLWNTLLRVCG